MSSMESCAEVGLSAFDHQSETSLRKTANYSWLGGLVGVVRFETVTKTNRRKCVDIVRDGCKELCSQIPVIVMVRVAS